MKKALTLLMLVCGLVAHSTTITVTNPAGGETFIIGQTVNVNWTWTQNLPKVKVELYEQSSGRTEILADSVVNTGSFSFTLQPSTSPIQYSTQYGQIIVSKVDSAGIFDYCNQFLIAFPPLVANAGNDTIICAGNSVMLGANPTAEGAIHPYTYSWSPIVGLSNANVANPMASPTTTTQYTVVVTDSENTTVSSSVTIWVDTLHADALTTTNVSCNGLADGSVSITGACGSPPYTYSIDGGITFQGSTVFQNLAAGTYSGFITDAASTTTGFSFTIFQPSQIVLTDSIFNLSCHGDSSGEVYLTVSGGSAPYSYFWTNGVATQEVHSLLAGTYAVTVTDSHGCTATLAATVNEPPQIQISGAVTNVSCFGGSNGAVNITVTGGVPAYSYFWSNFQASQNVVNLNGGLYYLIVTDQNGCQQRDSFLIDEPTQLQVSAIVPSGIICPGSNNGTINLTVSGGTPIYTFAWSNNNVTQNLTNLIAGYYEVTVSDANSCTAIIADTIIESPAITAHLISATGGSLPDTLVTVASGGMPPYTYWGSNATTVPTMFIDSFGLGSCYWGNVADANGCMVTTDTICYICSNQCVWPGDANYDGVADNNDLLPIGLGNGVTGPARIIQNIGWYGHLATNWVDTLPGAINYKHVDCDGNGVIDANDTSAILQNFSSVHAKNDGTVPWRANAPALFVSLVPDTTHAGDTMYAYLSLGDANTPAANVYGLAFTLNYDINVVDSTQTHATFGNSWFGTSADKISLAKDLKQGQVKCAITRIDHATRSGSGLIGQVSFVITTDNINGKNLAYYNMRVWLSDVVMIDNNGIYLPINGGQDSTNVEYEPTGIAEVGLNSADFKLQPNPANDQVSIYSSQVAISEVRLVDLMGRTVMDNLMANNKHVTLNVSDLPPGVYLVQIYSGKAMLAKRLIIAR